MNIDNKIISILSDYDGTLCPTSNVDQYGELGYLPKELEEILYDISQNLPICIVSSKDFSFLYKRTFRFSRIISCILGMETIFLKDTGKEDTNSSKLDKIINGSYSYDLYQSIPTEFRHLLVEASTLRKNSIILSKLANYIEANVPSIKVDKKYLTVEKDLLGGITMDWRNDAQEEWKTNSKEYKKMLKKGLHRINTNYAKIRDSVNKHPDYPIERLFIQEYSNHPFIDIYSSKLGKEAAYDCIVSEIFNRNQKLGKVIYLGDSENDNPAFKQADISIGIYSNKNTIPNLSCEYYLKYENLTTFLRDLAANNFIFCEAMIK